MAAEEAGKNGASASDTASVRATISHGRARGGGDADRERRRRQVAHDHHPAAVVAVADPAGHRRRQAGHAEGRHDGHRDPDGGVGVAVDDVAQRDVGGGRAAAADCPGQRQAADRGPPVRHRATVLESAHHGSLHVTNGDSAGGTLARDRARRRGAGLAGRPLRGAAAAGRSRAPARAAGRVPERLRLRRGGRDPGAQLEARDRRFLRALADGAPVVLWFEHDLYDQLQLLQILALAGGGCVARADQTSGRSPAARTSGASGS